MGYTYTTMSLGVVESYQATPNIKKIIERDHWDIIHSGIGAYQGEFEDLEFLQFIPTPSNPDAVILEVMGYGDALARLPVKKALAVALTDQRTNAVRFGDIPGVNRVEFVAGDISKTTTWEQIRAKLQGQTVNLLISRPFGGWSTLPPFTECPELYSFLLQESYSVLNPNSGVMFWQLPFFSNRGIPLNTLSELREQLSRYPGVQLDLLPNYYNPQLPSYIDGSPHPETTARALRLIKSAGSPLDLPAKFPSI